MATQEKLLKSLESLRSLINSNLTSNISKKKEKIQYCNIITESMGNASIRIAPNFGDLLGFSIEVLLQLCDDPESDVRMVVDECLNRLIRAMGNGNMSKIQIELHKEIKKNGPQRSLRAALWRFAELAHYIRPHKGKPYVANLMPCILRISERSEEMVHETLASSFPKIMVALGHFTTDNDIKGLLKAFLSNISNASAVIRRTTANCILTTCLNCRKPYVFITYILNNLLDTLIPINETHSAHLALGVLNCLKIILPHIKNSNGDEEIKGSFGVCKEVNETPLAVDRLLQVYELCLHYILDADHNIVNAALETLNVLLQNSPVDLISVLTSPSGINKSRIFYEPSNKLKQRSPILLYLKGIFLWFPKYTALIFSVLQDEVLGQLSMATTCLSGENSLETELMDSLRPDIEKWIDESKLSVLNITYARTNEYADKSLVFDDVDRSSNLLPRESSDYSNIAIGAITGDSETIQRPSSIADNLDRLVLSETSSEQSFTQYTDDKSLLTTNNDVLYQEVDIGEFRDKDVPLFYSSRLIIKSFLLSGYPETLIPDKSVRVSVKSLSLACLATIFKICPEIFLKFLDKTQTKDLKNKQKISDILLFKHHVDPQLRGVVRVLIGNFLKTVLVQNDGDYVGWIARNVSVKNDMFLVENLVGIIIEGLGDDSSNCCRQSLQALNVCLKSILESRVSFSAVRVLNVLPSLVKNPYWLVKVTLVEVVSELPYVTTHHVCGSSEFQDKILFNVLFEMLQDENQKVRSACSSAIVQIVPLLYFKQHIPNENVVTNKAKYYKNLYVDNLFEIDLDTSRNNTKFIKNLPFPFNACCDSPKTAIDQSLCRIITKLNSFLLTSTTKHFNHGCIETLCLLSNSYPPTVYADAWSCFMNFTITIDPNSSIFNTSNKELTLSSAMGLFNICIGLLQNTTIPYDLNCHLSLLKLGGNIFAGLSIQNLKPKTDLTLEDANQLWDMFTDKNLSSLTEQFFNHVLKVLNIFSHVLEELAPTQPQSKQAILSNLPASYSTLSPIKRRKSDLGEKIKTISPGKGAEKEEKGEKKENVKSNLMGYFANTPHYLKIYDILRTAYSNYKTTLDSEASEKFLELLKVTLQTLSQLLEIATLLESGRNAEEILNYFTCIFNVEPSSTVKCVQQLLKSLFGTNLTCHASDIRKASSGINFQEKQMEGLFYHNIFQKPYNEMSSCINSFHNSNKVDRDGDKTVMGYLHRRESKTSAMLPRGADKILANYIRLFEPMVIKSLKQYTITSDVKFQCKVLQLLCQLVQLRVNYLLLDSEQIFIGFVLKQFEYLEEGQISFADELIPKIFNFLVHLSYGKQHSKSIIGVPKIIQLCDGLMASGQTPLTHCIPALEPVIEDIFLLRNKSNTSDFKELETTREVLLSMLLRLLEYYDVINLLCLILNESKYCNDNTDKWSRWSKQVADVFLPMLKHNKIPINNRNALIALRKLVFILNPAVYKPLNDILLCLFDAPPYKENSIVQINRWVGKILTLFLIIFQVREETLLLKIVEVQSDLVPRSVFRNIEITADPLNATNTAAFFNGIFPEIIFVRFIFRVIDTVTDKCTELINTEDSFFLIEQLSGFLMLCLYIFQSGSHCKIANTAIELATTDSPLNKSKEQLPIEDINKNMIKLAVFFPNITFQWCYLLTLLNYNNRKFWSTIMQIPENYESHNYNNEFTLIKKCSCINWEIVRVGATIVFCDYLNENMTNTKEQLWFLFNNITLLVALCDEEPVSEFFSSLHRDSSNSSLVIQTISTKCLPITEPTFRTKVLKVVENVHSSQVGALLSLLLPKLLDCRQLALSRLVANLTSRKIELLLTMSIEEVNSQLSKEDLIIIMNLFSERKLVAKHEALVSLLNKLATQYYHLNPLELEQRRVVNPQYVKQMQINKTWFTSQVASKSQCIGVGSELSELLSCLDYDSLYHIMSNKDFNKLILKNCIAWAVHEMMENNAMEQSCLLKTTVEIIVKNVSDIVNLLPTPHQVFKVVGRVDLPDELRYSNELTELFSNDFFWSNVHDIIPSVTYYVKSFPSLSIPTIPDKYRKDFTNFAIVCLESVNYILEVDKNSLNVNYVDIAINCAEEILKNSDVLASEIHTSWLCSAINSLFKLVSYLLLGDEPLPEITKTGLTATLDSLEHISAGNACHQLSILVSWLERTQNSPINIPKFMLTSIKSTIVTLSRLPLVNSYLLTPPSAWKNGLKVKLSGTFHTQVPPLPIEFLQEIDILEEFIFRITLLGWTSRQQFEESWMCLLSVLSSNSTEENVQEEINTITHVTSLAIQAITSLLAQTLYCPVVGNTNVSRLLHVPRDPQIAGASTSVKKLKKIQDMLQYKFNEHAMSFKSNCTLTNVFNKSNLEKLDEHYSFGQISVEFLFISTKTVEVINDSRIATQVHAIRQSGLDQSGLDLNSCLQFLIDLYSQWIKSQSTPLRILFEVVKSMITISDLFTEKSQFVWMLEMCLDLTKFHTIEDELLQQYLVIGSSKAVAVLTPVSEVDLETYEVVKKLIVQNLKSGFLPSKLAGLHGILYILQGAVLGNTKIAGLSEEMQLIFPIAIDYVQSHINLHNGALSMSLDHSLLIWAIAFYLIENIEESNFGPDFISTIIQSTITNISQQNNTAVYDTLLKGLERLVIKKSITRKDCDQLVKLALEKMKINNPTIALPALQLLLTCIYISSSEELENPDHSSLPKSIPDNLIQTIEKISAIFDRIRKGFPFEVDVICSVLPVILNDFFPPSDILTKVLGEFLSPQQPHPKLLSRVVFKVFECAIEQLQLPLLQDWVVISLSNFTQSFSIGMATWCLTCFFISASTNKWLRSLFPYVQSRVGRYEYEDRNMLCIAGADFYNNLTNDKLKEKFVSTFNKVKDQADMPFQDLLASL